jgi:predicted dehydrogenase
MIRLGVIGAGQMGPRHVDAFSKIDGVKVAAICDVSQERARELAGRYNVPEVYRDLDEMLAKCRLDAVANVTPDRLHAPLSIKALGRGLHVLCEKPLATSYAEAMTMVDAAARAGTINMVNLTYRNSAAIQTAARLVREGRIGQVRHFEAYYLQSWLAQDAWGDWRTGSDWLWRLSTRHGSKGVLGDVGVHILDFATFPAGDIRSVFCRLKTFSKCEGNRIGEYELDANDSAVIVAELANGALGTIHLTRWATGHLNSLRLSLHGDRGAIRVDLDRSQCEVELCEGDNCRTGAWSVLPCDLTPSISERFIASIRSGRNDQPDFARGAAIQKALDACELSDKTGAPVSLA